MALPDKGILLALTGIDVPTLEAVSLLGEIELLVPAALLIGVALWGARRRAEALAWLTALALCIAVVGVLKTTLGSFQIRIFHFHEFKAASFPSGHASLSFAFYGGLAVLLRRRWQGRLARLAEAGLFAAPVAVTLAVWLLYWHPIIDVGVGTIVGLACVRICAALAERFKGRAPALSH
jgi:membrane-associated phospholipid phosphatase